jgi:hypothetical protein
LVNAYNKKLNLLRASINAYNDSLDSKNQSLIDTNKKTFENLTNDVDKYKEQLNNTETEYDNLSTTFAVYESEYKIYIQTIKDNLNKSKNKTEELKTYRTKINTSSDTFFEISKNMHSLFVYPMKKISILCPSILVIKGNTKFDKAIKQLKFNGAMYTLIAADISPYKGHVVAGLMCGNKEYVYDSNNIIAYDNWSAGDFTHYFSSLKESLHLDASFQGLEYLVYAIDIDDQKGGSVRNQINKLSNDIYYEKYMKYKTKYFKLCKNT